MASSADDSRITVLGQLNFRDVTNKFGVKRSDRRYHIYLIGQTGTGKSTLLENLIYQDIQNGEGLAVFDPHGDFLERLAKAVPQERKADLFYFNVPDPACPYGFNPLESVPPDSRPRAASQIIEAFKKIWGSTWGPRMEHYFRNALLTLLDQPSATLADLSRLFHDPGFRREAIGRISNPQVLAFWYQEFRNSLPRYRNEAVAPIENKLGAFLAHPALQRVLTRAEKNLNFREIMDQGKVLLVNLAKGKLGGDVSSLLGALLVSRLDVTALSRADQPEASRRDFYLYLDEFQNFTTLSLANMLSELRKYRLNLILAHQYLAQLEPEVREAILGNVGSIICFRVGPEDARLLAKYFQPKFSDQDLMNLSNYSIYLRLMIDGAVSKPFSAETVLPWNPAPAIARFFSLLRPLSRFAVRTISILLRRSRNIIGGNGR